MGRFSHLIIMFGMTAICNVLMLQCCLVHVCGVSSAYRLLQQIFCSHVTMSSGQHTTCRAAMFPCDMLLNGHTQTTLAHQRMLHTTQHYNISAMLQCDMLQEGARSCPCPLMFRRAMLPDLGSADTTSTIPANTVAMFTPGRHMQHTTTLAMLSCDMLHCCSVK
jgi:hypothetical protein